MPPPVEFRAAAEIGTLYNRDERSLREKYGEFAAPFFRIEISDQNDRVLSSAEAHVHDGAYDLNGLIVHTVEWDENDCEADMLKLSVNNPDVRVHDSRLFAEGNNVDLWMGYDGHEPKYMGRGIITSLQPTFGAEAIPSIEVEGYDISYFMMEEGKAEIVPEGTAWWERYTQTTDTNEPERRGSGSRSTHVSDTDRQARDRAGGATRSERELAQRHGLPEGQLASVDGLGTRGDLSRVEVHRVRTPPTRGQDESSGQSTRRTNWRHARPPRRRRRSGKVWRGLSDSEIAAAIFESYGIVPYVEATRAAARARFTERKVTERRFISDNYRDTDQQAEDARRQAREIGLPSSTVPGMSIDSGGVDLDASQEDVHLHEVVTSRVVREQTSGRRIVQKSGTSDWEFLKKLAAKHGFVVFVFFHHPSRRWIGYWGPMDHVPQPQEYEFPYNAGNATAIKEIRPRMSMRNQKTEVDLHFVDPRSGREQRLRVSLENASRFAPQFRGPDGPGEVPEVLGDGPQVTLTIHGQRTTVTPNRPFTSMEDARDWILAFWMRHASDFLQCEGTTIIGFPELRARQFHHFLGIGRYSGRFWVASARHKMGGNGYELSFSNWRVPETMNPRRFQGESELLTVDSNEIGERSLPPDEEFSRTRVGTV